MRVSRWLRLAFGTYEGKELARAEQLLEGITETGRIFTSKSDHHLKELAASMRKRAIAGESPDKLLEPVFALAREAAKRTTGLCPFDVQVLGGIALHRGNVVEMKTGEGKTLVATLPVVLNGLYGRGVHLVTVNDYLARRDAEWMGPVYEFMGLTVGVVTEDMDETVVKGIRKKAYAADVTYVTNHELVFDYLRDNLALEPDEVVQRAFNFAVVDEADLLLLDEARTPLIISGPSKEESGHSRKARQVVAALREEKDFQVDHRTRQAAFTDRGWKTLEAELGVRNLADPIHLEWQHALHNALLAHAVYKKDVDYIVDEDQVHLVDEFTGRVSFDKRFSDGLHQALEAKEEVTVRSEDTTLAKTSYQTFFRLYPKLCGMTGTAVTAREELGSTYGLRVVSIPTHRPMIREDLRSLVFRTAPEKLLFVADEIQALREEGRPVLVGTTSVKESEELSSILEARSIPHEVLNAKNHQAEAAVIAQAGRPRNVTISTNMAGRGVDIMLGGNPEALAASTGTGARDELDELIDRCNRQRKEVIEAGGLAVIGTSLHDSPRIDDQLRGRAGRQGDPGTSRFCLSLEDPIYRMYGEVVRGSQVLKELKEMLKDHPKGQPVEDPLVMATLSDLRRKVDVENQAIRKEVMQYDLVIAAHRETIYSWRRTLLDADPKATSAMLDDLLSAVGEDLEYRFFAGRVKIGRKEYNELFDEVLARFDIEMSVEDLGEETSTSFDICMAEVMRRVRGKIEIVKKSLGEAFTELCRIVVLNAIDELWTEHLTALERLDEGIGLRGYAELNPLTEFRREANLMYQDLLREIHLTAFSLISRARIAEEGFSGSVLPDGAPTRRTTHAGGKRRRLKGVKG